jgi:hypothetical protein
MDKLGINKHTVQAFYDPMFNQCQPAEAIRLYAGDIADSSLKPFCTRLALQTDIR